MQRTILSIGQGQNTTVSSTGSAFTNYCPISGGNMINAGYEATAGNGAYGESAFAAVYSRLYMAVGKTYTQNIALQGNVNVAGASAQSGVGNGGAGNLSCSSGAPAQLQTVMYYYDATDIDAITAGQGVGFMLTVSGTSGGNAIMPNMSVVCDTLNQGYCSPFMFSGQGGSPAGGQIFNNTHNYASVIGPVGFQNATAPGAAGTQLYSQNAFVASYLQWQTCTGNTDTDAQATCSFYSASTWGQAPSSATTLSKAVKSAGYVGVSRDATDIVAVPAGEYFAFYWNGNTSASTLHVGNAGVHMTAAGNNTCWLGAGASLGGASWVSTTTLTCCPFGGTRYDPAYDEAMSTTPTAGVYSGMAVQVGTTFGASTTFSVYSAEATDSGSGSGTGPSSTSNPPTVPPTAPWSATSLTAVASSASAWFYDATDIAAFTRSELLLTIASDSTGAGCTLQGHTLNFTAPAHLGLTTMGAG